MTITTQEENDFVFGLVQGDFAGGRGHQTIQIVSWGGIKGGAFRHCDESTGDVLFRKREDRAGAAEFIAGDNEDGIQG